MLPSAFNTTAFWSYVRKTPEGCWVWTRKPDTSGYGRFRVGPKIYYAHILSYLSKVGPIPEGRDVDHTCRNRACVRPGHLEAVTRKENTLRGKGPTAINANKTHCTRGHEFTAGNTIWKNGRRNCLACRQAKREEKKQRVRNAKRAPKPSGDVLRAHRLEGMTWFQIGVKYGVSDTAARKWGRQAGVR